MKMEYLIKADRDVIVKEVKVKEKGFVQMGDIMILFEKEEEQPVAEKA